MTTLTRRHFLTTAGTLAMVSTFAPLLRFAGADQPLPSVRSVKRHKTLVTIFLRGGADGLNLIVPFADEHYAKIRRSIAIPGPAADAERAAKAIDLDGRFGLHPRLSALKPLFDSGHAAALHAVGYAHNTRSHFEEQDTWETGVIGNTLASDGWLNRHLATSAGHGPIRAVAIGDNLPRILHGRATAFAIRGVEDLTIPVSQQRPGVRNASPEQVARALEAAYCCGPRDTARTTNPDIPDAEDLLTQSAGVTLEGVEQLQALARTKYEPAPDARYPNSDLSRKLQQVARLIKADLGLEVAQVDLGGWDTHSNQGAATGQFGNLAQQLADAIAAFTRDLGDRINDVLVVTLTDFGRTAAENGTNGTDHGWGNALLMVGGAVRSGTATAHVCENLPSPTAGRMVLGKWPGLAPDQLHQKRDLLHTTDFRDVLAECVTAHLGNTNLSTIFPAHTITPVGAIT